MKFFSWNVNGIRAVINKGALQDFFANFNPDILALQETKAKPEQVEIPASISEKYDIFWNSAERKGYSGTAIFIRKNIAKIENVLNDLPEKFASDYDFNNADFGNPNIEGRVLTIEFTDFYLINVYTPNAKDANSRLDTRSKKWDPAFHDFLSDLRKTKPVIFCGDLNVAHNEIDLANPKANVKKHGFTIEERTGFTNILASGFIDSFREKYPDTPEKYTWWSHFANSRANNRGWRIDYFGVDEKLRKNIKNADILPEVLGSDHCPILLEMDF